MDAGLCLSDKSRYASSVSPHFFAEWRSRRCLLDSQSSEWVAAGQQDAQWFLDTHIIKDGMLCPAFPTDSVYRAESK